ncbi:MAG: hypothetical protein A2908_03685 [Candidatus Staskawiczbacteria bacterium RIFCSPLOWO2_01_FULL_38_12b]|uniref:Uncharacterized protein n=1 Tax=Candidatus Staskawiczbacteria bacterium RIFCSPLOWO2_01_FULL_38_12b TaxID=1802214 RepID=A0A1G2IGN2_9BACT|nr:MAG: hypothetical protein A2908_03685 [Candidatus Staskawiczbacteria bacterium RIFCSPLOWO2_01_FULL_38_12b]
MLDLNQVMQYLIYLGILIGLALNLYVVKKIGKGIMNIVFISFGMSLFLVGLSSLFVSIYELQLEDISLHIFWHGIIYMAFISLIWGGYRIKKNMESPNPEGFNSKDILLLGAMLLFTLNLFIIAPILNNALYAMLTGSIIETIGLHHLVAFILGFVGAGYLFYIKGGPQAGKSMTFMGIYLFLLGSQHLWEILTETFHLFLISGDTIELVEKFIILPAIIFFILAQLSIVKFIRNK